MAETVGQRLYKIRLALGDGVREPETLEDFSARIERETGQFYSPMTLSLLERGKQKWKLEDVDRLASIDPLTRGRTWLAWGVAAIESPYPATPAQAPDEKFRLPLEVEQREARRGKRMVEEQAKQNRASHRKRR